MARASPIKTALNAGEFSPLMLGRVDYAKYQNGLRVCENFVPLVQGAVRRRSGSRYSAAAKNATRKARVHPFQYSTTAAYILEFGHQYIRFYKNRSQLLSGSAAYEISSPYDEGDLFELQFEQSADVLYIVHGDYEPRKLIRNSDTSWTLSTITFSGGPFLDENDTATTIYASAATGSVTLTASSSIFASTDVGRLVRLHIPNLGDLSAWEPAVYGFAVNSIARNEERVYKCTSLVERTGTTPPTHIYGKAYDGPKNGARAEWEFTSLFYGIAKITAYSSGTSVTATVQSIGKTARLPDKVVGSGNATTRWALSPWSSARGYPRTTCLYQNRFGLGGSTANPDTLWLSVSNDYENFDERDEGGEVLPDSAINITLASGQVNAFQWIKADKSEIMVGTTGQEVLVGPASQSEPLAPDNIKQVAQSSHGSAYLQALRVDEAILFLQTSGRKVREAQYDYQVDRVVANDLTILAEHVTQSGVVQMAWQPEPDAVVWSVLADGGLSALTYNKSQDVIGWHRHIMGGYSDAARENSAVVESVATLPSPDNSGDDLWMIVRRYINGSTKRYVEYIPNWNIADDVENAHFCDCGIVYNGAATTSITGLTHLNGETVTVLADGEQRETAVVSGGAITLSRAGSIVHVGLPYTSQIETLPIEAGSQDGTSQGKQKRVRSLGLRLYRSGPFEYSERRGDEEGSWYEHDHRRPDEPFDSATALKTGNVVLPWPGDWQDDPSIRIRTSGALPLNIVTLMPRLNTSDGG